MLGERLGKARRLAYALVVDAKGTEIARVARRGVKVISLSGSRAKYPSSPSSTVVKIYFCLIN